MKKRALKNTIRYMDSILEALTDRFAALAEENDQGEDISGTAIAGDAILYDVCRVVNSRKWILPEGMSITLEAMDLMLEKNFKSLSNVYDHFSQILKKVSPKITLNKLSLMSIPTL